MWSLPLLCAAEFWQTTTFASTNDYIATINESTARAAKTFTETTSNSSAQDIFDVAERTPFNETRLRAEKGEASAQFDLARMYATGSGAVKDSSEAVKWYRKAAGNGHLQAKYHLGTHILYGTGVARDITEGIRILSEAVEEGSRDAANVLSSEYLFGYSVPKDFQAGLKWLRVIAERGDVEAQVSLGRWLSGDVLLGVPPNYVEAAKWFRRAAETGNRDAQSELGYLYYKGSGVRQSFQEAAKWCQKAALQGEGSSMNLLGLMYELGEGVPQDFVEAYKWYNLAEVSDSTTAVPGFAAERRKHRDALSGKMTSSQIAEAQRLARDFKPRKSSKSDSTFSEGDSSPSASGTGFVISPDGFLVSNAHVVEDAAQIRLVTSAGLVSAKVVKIDAANDLALLKAEGEFSPLPVAPSRAVKLGNTVITVGFPNIGLQGFAPKLARGEIASLSGAGDDARYFQISVPVQPGNSGGALVDSRGNVVGVVAAKLSARAALVASGALPENVNYAIKSSYLLSFLESMPEVSARLKEPNSKERKFEDVVKDAEQAAVLVLVY